MAYSILYQRISEWVAAHVPSYKIKPLYPFIDLSMMFEDEHGNEVELPDPVRIKFKDRRWSRDTHSEWPQRFRATVKTLLLACTATSTGATGAGTRQEARYSHAWLPTELVLQIVQYLALGWDWTNDV